MLNNPEGQNYGKLVKRLNKFPQRVPPSKALYKILSLLFSEKEAGLIAQLPIKPFTIKSASRIWKMEELEARKILDELASRAILLDLDNNGEQQYLLPPPMAGFFEFSLMRIREDIDQKALSELLYQYLNIEEDFIKDLFLGSETRLGRVFVQEPVLTNEGAIHILDYEKASSVIRESSHIGIGMCYCRQKMEHINLGCEAPKDVCMTFNSAAASLIFAKVDLDICLGCGICVRSCSFQSMYLRRRKHQIITPANSVHRTVLMAIEKGLLQNLIFDNQALASHRAMAAILSAILKMPPIKRVMASKQMKSVYLERLLSKVK